MPAYETEVEPDPCPLCGRPNYFPSDHHLVPKSRGGKVTKTICSDCHRGIHSIFTNKELEKEFHTVGALLAHASFAKQIAWLRKRDPKRPALPQAVPQYNRMPTRDGRTQKGPLQKAHRTSTFGLRRMARTTPRISTALVYLQT